MAVSTYLVERYWPGVSRAELADAVARGRRSAAAMRREGKRIRYLQATLVPDQETVLCLMEAESAELVVEVNRRAGIPYDRIAAAIAVRTTHLRKQEREDSS